MQMTEDQRRNQKRIETFLDISAADAEYINAHPDNDSVQAFRSLFRIMVNEPKDAGMQRLEALLEDIRKEAGLPQGNVQGSRG